MKRKFILVTTLMGMAGGFWALRRTPRFPKLLDAVLAWFSPEASLEQPRTWRVMFHSDRGERLFLDLVYGTKDTAFEIGKAHLIKRQLMTGEPNYGEILVVPQVKELAH